MEQYDSFSDVPFPAIYRELDVSFPGSKFILTVRDPDSWWLSILNHMNRIGRLGGTFDYFESLQYNQFSPRQTHFELKQRSMFLRKFRQHNEEVLRYFGKRPDDLLTINFQNLKADDFWQQVCSFVGRLPISASLPWVNRGEYSYFDPFQGIELYGDRDSWPRTGMEEG